ncbi:hypothetical protein FO519_010771, partial [Halicephalobus sp. NKZ332]
QPISQQRKRKSDEIEEVAISKRTRKNKVEDSEIQIDDDAESDFVPESGGESDEDFINDDDVDEKPEKKPSKRISAVSKSLQNRKVKDDANDEDFSRRLRNYEASLKESETGESSVSTEDDDFHELNEDYKISNSVWSKLYKYQKTGIRWLHELHSHCVGGILADEMGLGKTVQ